MGDGLAGGWHPAKLDVGRAAARDHEAHGAGHDRLAARTAQARPAKVSAAQSIAIRAKQTKKEKPEKATAAYTPLRA
jgi:hypothetical protein